MALSKKYIGRGLLLGVFAVIVYIFVFGDYGAYRIWKQKKELAQLRQTIQVLRQKQEQLKRDVDLLRNDPESIEKIAREEYGMIREGELLYKIVSSPQEREKEKAGGLDEPHEKEGGGKP
jgi:cell division protein FtsB